MRLRSPALVLLSLLCTLVGLTACGHYQVGTGAKLAFATLYVEPIENQTHLPQARALVSTQLREAFLRDGRVALVNSAAEADAVLGTTIKDYHRDVISALESDPGLARKFALTLTVECTLRDNRTGQALFSARPIHAQRDIFTDGGQLQAEYQSLPLLAESLAKKVAASVLDVW